MFWPPLRPLSTLFCLFACLSLCAQTKDFYPAQQDDAYLSQLSAKYQQQYKADLDKLPSRNRHDLVEAYQHRWENIKEKFDKKEVYTSRAAQAYLDRLVSAVRQGNPGLANIAVSCYFSRSYIPNAAYIGEGIILFNMGLFQRLDNESQAVFVLCHELAHYLLRHSETAYSDMSPLSILKKYRINCGRSNDRSTRSTRRWRVS
ncbi:MAG TPA: M48 family metalloprotease [Puia sp.]